MKNRTLDRPKNGKFFCWHDWQPNGEVGVDWDLSFGVKVPVVCSKCSKVANIANYRMNEWPDELVNSRKRYT